VWLIGERGGVITRLQHLLKNDKMKWWQAAKHMSTKLVAPMYAGRFGKAAVHSKANKADGHIIARGVNCIGDLSLLVRPSTCNGTDW